MTKLKLGLVCIGYQCREHLEKVFQVWGDLKSGKVKSDLIDSVHISLVSGPFEETIQLGYPTKSTDGSIEYFQKMVDEKILDNFILLDTPQKEYEMWSANLSYLYSQKVDLIIMVNMDEIWTLEEIEKAIKFVSKNHLVDYFNVNFKNYCIDYNTWVDDFSPPRIWWANRNGGIKRFYRDDRLEYNNGKQDIQVSNMKIPRHVLFPKHYSWAGSPEYLKRKAAFGILRYGLCSYKWNEECQKLELNDEYYHQMRIIKPVLNHD